MNADEVKRDDDLPQWTFRVQAAPTYAGAYWIGGVGVGIGLHLARRPLWLHRTMMYAFFGWQWQDEVHS